MTKEFVGVARNWLLEVRQAVVGPITSIGAGSEFLATGT